MIKYAQDVKKLEKVIYQNVTEGVNGKKVKIYSCFYHTILRILNNLVL